MERGGRGGGGTIKRVAGGGGGPGKEGYCPDAVVSIRPLEISSGL